MLAKPRQTEDNKIVVDFYDEDGNFLYTQEVNPEIDKPFTTLDEAKEYASLFNQEAEVDLQALIKKKCDAVNKHKKDVIENHFKITFKGKQYPVDFDLESQVNLAGIYAKALGDPTFSIDFITGDNQIIHLEHNDILTLGQQAQEWKSSIIIEAAKLKQKIREVKSLEELEAIEIVLAGIPHQGDE